MGRPKAAANRLEQARADLAQADERIREVEAKRREALLRDNDTEAAKLDAELEQLRRLARGHGDKIALLEAAAADEENAARVREHEGLIRGVERKLSERQELVVAMANLVPELNRLFRAIINKSREIDAAWPWQGADRMALQLPRECAGNNLAHELFRISHVFAPGGGLNNENSGLRLPGSRSPDLRLMEQPEAVQPMCTTYADAARYGSELMRGQRTSAPTNGVGTSPVAPSNGQAARKQTPAEERLAALLQKQAQLAALTAPTPEQDSQYAAVVVEVAKAALAVDAEQGAHHV